MKCQITSRMTSWRYSVVCSNKASLNAPLKNLVWLADCFELLKPKYLTHIGMLRQCSCSPFALCKSHNKHGNKTFRQTETSTKPCAKSGFDVFVKELLHPQNILPSRSRQ